MGAGRDFCSNTRAVNFRLGNPSFPGATVAFQSAGPSTRGFPTARLPRSTLGTWASSSVHPGGAEAALSLPMMVSVPGLAGFPSHPAPANVSPAFCQPRGLTSPSLPAGAQTVRGTGRNPQRCTHRTSWWGAWERPPRPDAAGRRGMSSLRAPAQKAHHDNLRFARAHPADKHGRRLQARPRIQQVKLLVCTLGVK